MAIGAKSCSILGRFCFRFGSVIALAGARDLLAIGTESGSFSKVFWPLGLVNQISAVIALSATLISMVGNSYNVAINCSE